MLDPKEIPVTDPKERNGRLISKRLDLKSSITTERIYSEIGPRFAPLQIVVV